ncbi:GD22574 [Drosophila simulans]|uniref:UDP-N-acetylglucosamine diphosphorylase n=1 Tax=Drosophila simulans TaxID=7240 RepID=B4Q4N3_DROSI|nr:GD22574 [Drosophila simulans]
MGRHNFSSQHQQTHVRRHRNAGGATAKSPNAAKPSPTMTDYLSLHSRLAQVGQEHLLKFWPELTNDERIDLVRDIEELNLDEIKLYFDRATVSMNENGIKLDDRLQPLPEGKLISIARAPLEKLDAYRDEGLLQISNGHVAVLLMAGGQGTRLGFDHPKGMYDVGLQSRKTLFRIQAERILKLEELAQEANGKRGHITWYIMTSEHTVQPTYDYFVANNFFGLKAENVLLFEQGSLPCFEYDGRIILDEKHRVARAPDGNGGIYRAMKRQGILDDMQKRGVLYLHAHSVDNILIKVADPVFIGYCVQEKADCAAKVVEKAAPNEAVGVVAIVDGKYQVFVFDVFEFAQKFVAMEVPRDEEFSALKNSDAAGKDCPSTARSDLHRLHKKYIEGAGGIVHGEVCEISPFVTYAGENLASHVEGKSFTSPVYLRDSRDPLHGHL